MTRLLVICLAATVTLISSVAIVCVTWYDIETYRIYSARPVREPVTMQNIHGTTYAEINGKWWCVKPGETKEVGR